jgi:transposase
VGVIRAGPPDSPVIVYYWCYPSHSARGPLQYLSEYEGHLQTDGYEGYTDAGALPGDVHVGCRDRVCSRSSEAAKASSKRGSAQEALGPIGRLYRIERELRAEGLSRKTSPRNERYRLCRF